MLGPESLDSALGDRWIGEVRRRLQARPGSPLEARESLSRAAVLVPLFVRKGQLWILFTRRTETVEHHRGQISFPGGVEEPGDASPLDTALRETQEEIGLDPADALLLGVLSPIETITNFHIEPFVAAVPQPYIFRPAEAEIAEILEVPVPALLAPSALEERRLPGQKEAILFYRYGAHIIWGATARILSELLRALS